MRSETRTDAYHTHSSSRQHSHGIPRLAAGRLPRLPLAAPMYGHAAARRLSNRSGSAQRQPNGESRPLRVHVAVPTVGLCGGVAGRGDVPGAEQLLCQRVG